LSKESLFRKNINADLAQLIEWLNDALKKCPKSVENMGLNMGRIEEISQTSYFTDEDEKDYQRI
jgi:hypothetical protein